MALLATGTDRQFVGLRMPIGPIVTGRDRDRLGGSVELEQKPNPGGLFTLGRMPKAEVANLVQTLGQNVLKEPTHEFLTGNADGSPSVRFAMLMTNGDSLVVKADDAAVGYGDAEDVSSQIVEHALLAFAPSRAMDDPGLGPCGGGNDQVRPARRERGPDLAAHELGKRLDGDEEVVTCWMPRAAVIGDAATGHQAVDMRMKVELLRPGM